ncbi:hypothetical protein SK128_013979, partial [Halocaridina rubra]
MVSLININILSSQKTVWVFVAAGNGIQTLKETLEPNVPENLFMILITRNSFSPLSRSKRSTDNNNNEINFSYLPKEIHYHRKIFSESSIHEITNRKKSLGDHTQGKPELRNMFINQRKNHQYFDPLSSVSKGEVIFESTSRTKRQTELFKNDVKPTILAYTAIRTSHGNVVFKKSGEWSRLSGLILGMPLLSATTSNFFGRTLMLTTVHKPKVFEINKSDGSRVQNLEEVHGYTADIIRVLQTNLNFTISLTFTNNFGGQLPNGSWSGMIGDLVGQEASLSPLDFSPSWARAQVVDFSEWFSRDPVIVISQAPKPIMKPFLMLEIFSLWISDFHQVWLAIICVGIVTGFLLWLLDVIVNQLHQRGQHSEGSELVKNEYYRLLISVRSTLKLFVNQ